MQNLSCISELRQNSLLWREIISEMVSAGFGKANPVGKSLQQSVIKWLVALDSTGGHITFRKTIEQHQRRL